MESPADGFVKHILAEVGQTLSVGQPILVLGDKDEEVPQSFIEQLKATDPERPQVPEATATVETVSAQPQAEPAQVPTQTQPISAEKVKASPRAKKLADQLGVDLTTVIGTGPGGRITEQDVKKAAAKPTITPAEPPTIKLGDTITATRIQKITARRMLESKQNIPCFYLTVKADVTKLFELRNQLNKTSEVKIAYHDFIMHAVATALMKFPLMTGQLVGDVIKLTKTIDIGLAIAVPDGLVAPIIKEVNKKNVTQIARESKALIERARSNKLTPTDLEGGCITVSNLGAFGIESFIPIVVPGQCSILGIGQIADTCVPNEGGIRIRKLMSMTLSVDHRVTNGAYAAQFLDYVRKLLEDTSTFES